MDDEQAIRHRERFQLPPEEGAHARIEDGRRHVILPPIPDTPANTAEAFGRVWQACGCLNQEEATQWYKALKADYQMPARSSHHKELPRHYHNWRHITACLMELEGVRPHFAHLDLASVEMALWFHDVVYHPKSSTNEEESAQVATAVMERGKAPQAVIEKVASLILATKSHPEHADPDTALVLDIDLSILGKPPEEYDAYEEAIREEYSWVPQAMFADRRHRILEVFLRRPQLYLTQLFRERYECQARLNLTRAIERLPLLMH